MFIKKLLEYNALKYPQKIAVSNSETQITYSKLLAIVQKIAGFLTKLNIEKDQFTGVFVQNKLEDILIIYSLSYLQIPFIPISIKETQEALMNIQNQIDFKIILFVSEYKDQLPISFSEKAPFIPKEINIQNIINETNLPLPKNQLPFDMAILKFTKEELDITANIILTSGTTGTPKGIVQKWSNHFYSAKGVCDKLKFNTRKKWLLNLNLNHIGGLAILWRSLLKSAQIHVFKKTDNLNNLLSKNKGLFISIVPTQLKQLLKQNKAALAKFECILVGADKCPINLIKKALKNKINIYISYGMSEASSTISIAAPNDLQQNFHTSGELLKYGKIKIAKKNKIFLRGQVVCKIFLKNNNFVSLTNNKGWYETSDLGKIENKQLYILGRADNMFISGGKNIYPKEIESILKTYPDIEKVKVKPVPDKKFGSRPAAFIKFKNEIKNKPTLDMLNQFICQKLPRYKQITMIKPLV